MKEVELRPGVNICETCPARSGQALTAKLRGSSFRRRTIEQDEGFKVVVSRIFFEEYHMAEVQVANLTGHDDAIVHDDDFLKAVFEQELPKCQRPTPELTSMGFEKICTPVSKAIDAFIETNY